MSYPHTTSGAISGGAVRERSVSRIENDVELVKSMTNHIEQTTERIIQHSRNLGYYEPPSDPKSTAAPTPVISTLADALRALDGAINHCSGALNAFD